jgi:hypothetical protein
MPHDRSQDDISSKGALETAKRALAPLREKGPEYADAAFEQARIVAKTKVGKRALTGAAAGAAIGLALPFVSVTACALLGAGALVFWKSAKDSD